jgi:hypothetical protein
MPDTLCPRLILYPTECKSMVTGKGVSRGRGEGVLWLLRCERLRTPTETRQDSPAGDTSQRRTETSPCSVAAWRRDSVERARAIERRGGRAQLRERAREKTKAQRVYYFS